MRRIWTFFHSQFIINGAVSGGVKHPDTRDRGFTLRSQRFLSFPFPCINFPINNSTLMDLNNAAHRHSHACILVYMLGKRRKYSERRRASHSNSVESSLNPQTVDCSCSKYFHSNFSSTECGILINYLLLHETIYRMLEAGREEKGKIA